jgi:outer membrane protein assembly factor BamB
VRLIEREKVALPDLDKDKEVLSRLEQLYEGHRASIVYVPSDEELDRPALRSDVVPTMIFAPLVPGSSPGAAPDDDAITLALARGVLYAQKRSNGAVKWALRVGIDTTALPVRVPRTASSPERILVLSSDAETLTALDAEGNELWKYHLTKPCLGRPVVVDQRAYLPTYDGQVHEIELALGKLRGRYQLGQRLTLGGARQEGTKRIFFPADDSCVYVLDVGEQRCQAILYSGHPSGSLRGEPLVVAPVVAGVDAPAYLILNQTAGLDAMQLRVFELPIPERGAAALPLSPPPRVRGWTWFPPAHDGEKLVMLSDEGVFGLFGIRQARNQDPALFPWLPGSGAGGISLDPYLKPEARAPGRSQVVQVQGDDFWVLAHGKLQRLSLRWQSATGPKLTPSEEWGAPLSLGSPLHASQVEEDKRTGHSTLFLVTQHLTRQTVLSTAVDDERGSVLWQRQLGLVCRGEPMPIPVANPPGPLLLALDEGGGLFMLDPSGTSSKLLAPALDVNPDVPPLLVPAPDGQSVYEIACPGDGKHLVVRHIKARAGERQLEFVERTVALRSPLAGTPAIVGAWLVLPLANGDLARLPLPLPRDGAVLEAGAPWRSRDAGLESRCPVAALGGGRFLAGDGGRGLTCWEWTDKDCLALPKEHDPPMIELRGRLIAAPLVLPRETGDAAARVCVADATGVVTLLQARDNGALEKTRSWDLHGTITAGPFLSPSADGTRIGCVVSRTRLVWLDPAKAEPLWEYSTGGKALVGQPRRIEDLVVVADQSGRYLGLNPKTGRPEGPGYSLEGSVVPAASPTAFGPGRLFVPLSDGTALLLPLRRLQHPLREFPFWP